MEDLLRNLMNCGIIIYKDNAKFVLKKVATPADPRTTDAFVVFDDYAEAIKNAKVLLNIKNEDEMIVRDSSKSSIWKIQMMYQHRGLGVKFEDLGELPSTTYPEAVRLAKQRAQEFADSDSMVESWDVKVYPSSSN